MPRRSGVYDQHGEAGAGALPELPPEDELLELLETEPLPEDEPLGELPNDEL